MPHRRDQWKEFRTWLESPQGQALLDAESQRLGKRVENLFGYHFLVLGDPQFLNTLNSSPILHRVWIHPEARSLVKENESLARVVHPNLNNINKTNAPLQGESNEHKTIHEASPLVSRQDKLAILADEIDVVLLAHCLENIQNPHEVLREAYRVLKAEGHVIISGFNPWSVWGVWKKIMRYIKRVPWEGSFISTLRLKDWLALLGFDVVHEEKCFFRLPFTTANFIRKTKWIEWLGKYFFAPFGACYIIQAKKRVLTLTPIRPVWERNKKILPTGMVEPVARVE